MKAAIEWRVTASITAQAFLALWNERIKNRLKQCIEGCSRSWLQLEVSYLAVGNVLSDVAAVQLESHRIMVLLHHAGRKRYEMSRPKRKKSHRSTVARYRLLLLQTKVFTDGLHRCHKGQSVLRTSLSFHLVADKRTVIQRKKNSRQGAAQNDHARRRQSVVFGLATAHGQRNKNMRLALLPYHASARINGQWCPT